MVAKYWVRALAALALISIADAAFAQPQPQIEIDFARTLAAQVPLSPMLSGLIALALAAAAILVLRRNGQVGRFFGWLLLGFAAAATWSTIDKASIVSDAVAFVPTLQLTNSPATLTIPGDGTYTAQNTSGATISLTQVKLNNAGLFIIVAGTTCTVGLVMQPQATCVVVVNHLS